MIAGDTEHMTYTQIVEATEQQFTYRDQPLVTHHPPPSLATMLTVVQSPFDLGLPFASRVPA